MLPKLRKSSSRVTLVLIGVAALAGCSEERRDVYASRQDCLADWGNKPQDCTPATEERYAGHHYFYGPSYTYSRGWGSSGWTPGARSSRAIASSSASVARGGFGSTGRGSSGARGSG